MYKSDVESETSNPFDCELQSPHFGAIDPRTTLDRLIRRNGTTYSAVSKILGRNSAYVQQFIKRGTPQKLDEQDRALLAQRFGVSEEALGGRVTEKTTEMPGAILPVMDILNVMERSHESNRGAGFDGMMFDKRWLNSIAPSNISQLVVLLAFGDNMHPTISSGDVLIVDRSERAASRNGIYVICYASAYSINRITLNSSNDSVVVSGDNETYLVLHGVNRFDVDVWGRVLWVGQRFD